MPVNSAELDAVLDDVHFLTTKSPDCCTRPDVHAAENMQAVYAREQEEERVRRVHGQVLAAGIEFLPCQPLTRKEKSRPSAAT